MALKLGINTNQLRKWIQLHQVANEAAAAGSAASALPAFAPVVEISGVTRVPESAVALERLRTQAPAAPQPSPRLRLQPALLTARLPNGVTVELECGGQDVALVKAMIEALGAR